MIKYRSLNAHLLGTRGMAVESDTGALLNDNGEQAIATPNLVDRPAVCDCASNTEKMVKIICWSSLGSIMIKEKGGRRGGDSTGKATCCQSDCPSSTHADPSGSRRELTPTGDFLTSTCTP